MSDDHNGRRIVTRGGYVSAVECEKIPARGDRIASVVTATVTTSWGDLRITPAPEWMAPGAPVSVAIEAES